MNFIRSHQSDRSQQELSHARKVVRRRIKCSPPASGAGIQTIPRRSGFCVSAIGYFFIVGIIALTIAAKFCLAGDAGHGAVPSYGRLRPLHVNGMLFGWLLAADMGLTLLHRAAAVRREAVEREARRGDGGAVERHRARRGVRAAGRLQPGPRVRRTAAAARHPGGGRVGDVRRSNLRHHRARASTSRCTSRIWYTMGTILWTAFVYITGNFAVDVHHRASTRRTSTGCTCITRSGLIFTPIGLAIAYYFIPKASNTPLYSHKLSMIGFWSLAFVYVWTGAHHMLHGPISQWLQTIAIAFSVMLLIPVWAVVYNFFATMKGQWHQLRENVPLKFLMSGVVFYLLTCFQGPMHSLRSRERDRLEDRLDSRPRAHGGARARFRSSRSPGRYYVVPRMWRTKLH